MPSFLRNYRSFSFPPCLDGLERESPDEKELPDIDDDPFAHFITPIDEAEDPYDMSLSAGIIVSSGPRSAKASKFRSNVADKWARYVQQHHSQLHSQYHTPTIYEEDEESFMSLDDDRLNAAPAIVSQISVPRIMITEPTRGRAQESAARKATHRRRASRTLSGHRHSWREPSPDLFTLDESEEEEDQGSMIIMAETKRTIDSTARGRPRSRARGGVSQRAKL